MNVGIYKISHTPTKRIYIGQTRNMSKRLATYKNCGGGGSTNSVIKRAILKHGWDQFTFEPIVYCEEHMLNDFEKKIIAMYECRVPVGFNVQEGGDVRAVHESTKALISQAKKGKKASEEQKQKMSVAAKKSWIGRVPSEHQRAALKAWLERRVVTDEVKAKIADAQRKLAKTNPEKFARFSGKNHTEHTKQKMSLAHIGKDRGEEFREKMKEVAKKRWQNPEYRAKVLAAKGVIF